MNTAITTSIATNLLSNDGPFSATEDAAAEKEGWNIFCTDDLDKPYRLEKIDELALLDSDGEAWNLVVNKAIAGSALHTKALTFLKSFSVNEYADIIRHADPSGELVI